MTIDRLRRIVRLRLRSLVAGAAADRELDEELRDHVERQIDANIASGMTPDGARTAALRAIGGLEQRKEEMRDARGVMVIENLARDTRLALRQLRKQPGFAITAILSLALGIGANTAIFQLLTALSLRPLPVQRPHELVEIRLTGEGRDGTHTGRNRQVSLPQYEEFARRQDVLTSLAAVGDARFNLSATGEVRFVEGIWVSGNFFDTLGMSALLGRLITPEDDRAGCAATPVAVISYALWQSEFGGRPDVIGQRLPGGGTQPQIIGVTPPRFFGIEVGRQYAVAQPICASGFTRRDHWWLAAVGRLKPGITREAAAARLRQLLPSVQEATMPDYKRELADEYMKMGLAVADASSGLSPLRRDYQQPLLILLGISALVLLIAAVNLANLLLARATARREEFAVRLAIGGSRGRVLQQVLIESAVIAVLGSIAALGVAVVASESIPPLISTRVDRIHLDVSLDWRIFGFTAAAAIVTALIFGSAPAIRAASASLRTAARGAAANDGLSIRRGLVSIQIAITLVLLFGGLLFVQTFRNLSTVEPGARDPGGILIATVFFNQREYPPERRPAAYAALDERLAAVPGVQSLTDTYATPLGGSFWDTDIHVGDQFKGESYGNRIGSGYFKTLGIPLLAGRDFDRRDQRGSPLVAIVNQSFAKHFFDGDPIGRHFTWPNDAGGPGVTYEVIGVAMDQKYGDLREPNPNIFFVASAQLPEQREWRRYLIRTTRPMPSAIAAIGAAVTGFDSTLAIRFSPLDVQIAETMLQERLMARLSSLFGAVALILAIVGLYGVMSYTVASRRSEIGVRVALGATRLRIVSMIMSDVGRMLLAGVVIGTALSLVAARGVRSLLFGLEPDDPVTLLIAVAALLITGAIAALWPARRATTVDPLTALREN
ncbi:MAG TPA: ABC transporter permease [Vicinamibacterales bacterium]|nr:ABC transporter permease [Vicinamibacterales bacterium]